MTIEKVRKRDGSVQPFALNKITNAVFKALQETESGGSVDAVKVAETVLAHAMSVGEEAATAEPATPEAVDHVAHAESMMP